MFRAGIGVVFLLAIFLGISPYVSTIADTYSFPVLYKFDLLTDITEKGGSYRFYVWNEALTQLISEPKAWVLGFGPGKVVTYLFGDNVPVYHPHNTFLFVLHSYGILAFILFVVLIMLLLRKVQKNDKISNHYYPMVWYYIVIFIFDVHLSSSQFLVFHILLLALLVSVASKHGYDKPSMVSV
jgi:O-antigen ligase